MTWKIEYNIAVMHYTVLSQYQEAIALGRAALHLFGMELPTENLDAAIASELDLISINLRGRTITDLRDLPPMVNPKTANVSES